MFKFSVFNSKIIKNKNWFQVISLSFFIVFGFFSILDANSRILITDPVYYLFRMINDSGFMMPKMRYTSIINQFLVVLGIRANLPLSFLIPLYSFSFVLVRYLYFYIATGMLKNKPAGVAIIAITILGVSESYFRPTSESSIAMFNSILFYAFLSYLFERYNFSKRFKIYACLVTPFFILFGYFTHPIALFSLLFVIIFFSVRNNLLKYIHPYIVVVLTLTLFMGQAFLVDNGSHHNSLYGNLLKNPFAIFFELPEYYSFKFFISHVKNIYLPVVIMILCSIFLLARQKRFSVLLFFVIYLCAYFVIACTSFKAGDANMQMEKIFLPLCLISALVLGDIFVFISKVKHMVLVLCGTILILYGMLMIGKSRPVFNDRIDYVEQIVEEADNEKNRKLVVKKGMIDRKIIFSWALGIETLMISTMDSDKEPLTVYNVHYPGKIDKKMKILDNFIASPFQTSFSYERFNVNYFELPLQEYQTWDNCP